MHTYSIDRDIRRTVTIAIFVLSMVFSILSNKYLSEIIQNINSYFEGSSWNEVINLIQWLELNPNIISVPFWYALLTFLYDFWIWKWPFFIFLHQIPNLNGIWEGKLTSSYNKGKEIPIRMEIKQTWTQISFHSQFEKSKSRSYSNVAAIRLDGHKGTMIYFGFENESADVKQNMQSYEGYNVLILQDKDTITARYFNNRQNPNPQIKGGNKGVFKLKRRRN